MDDEDELAELRAQRAARSGQRATLSELREQQRKAQTGRQRADYYERNSSPPEAAALGHAGTGELDDQDAADEGLKGYLPVSFGKQTHQPAAKPDTFHQQSKRPSVGPPRPPNKQQQQQTGAKGPARPPAVGPPRPTAVSAEPGSVGAGDTATPSPAVGPPRPPSGPSGGWMTVEDVIGQQTNVQDSAAAAAPKVVNGDAHLMGPPKPPPAAEADDDEHLVGPPRPPAAAGADGEGDDDDDDQMVGPSRPPADAEGDSDEDDDEDEDDDDDAAPAEYDPYGLPVAHEVTLEGHGRAVSCLDIEHSGTRLITGSMDYSLRIFDFNGMKADLKSFRDLTPSDGHPVLSVSWSPTGDQFLCVTGSSQPRFYDRDGRLLGECVRGDMYIRDMKNTKGHITSCTGGCWHPTDRFTAATCSEDGTVRIWDAHNILQKTVVRPSTPSAARVAVTTCGYNTDGKLLAAGLVDGTIQVWGVGGKFGTSAAVGIVLPPSAQMVEKQGWTYVSRPSQLLRGAHEQQCEITSLAFSQDNRLLASRSMDGTMKLWDLRNFKKPLGVWDNLPANYPTTNVIFSPDERLILTGTAAGPNAELDAGGAGAVVLVDVKELTEVRRVGMTQHAAAVRWHPTLNQIFVGIGDRHAGSTRVLYDPAMSDKGVLSAAGRAPRVANPFDVGLPLVIKTPHALPMFREERLGGKKRQREKLRQDALKTRKPDPGATAGMGRAGRIGTTGGTLLTQHLMKTRGKLVSVDAEMDPREAILRHGDKKGDSVSLLTAAYAKTQPEPVFAEPEPDEDEDE